MHHQMISPAIRYPPLRHALVVTTMASSKRIFPRDRSSFEILYNCVALLFARITVTDGRDLAKSI